MIAKIIFNSRATEVAAVSRLMIKVYKESELSSDTNLEVMFSDLEAQEELLTLAIKRIKTESPLEMKDKLRDDQLRALFYMVKGYLYHPDGEVKKSAQIVEKVLADYGLDLAGKGYSSETSLIVSLLNNLAKPEMQEAIVILSGCSQVVEALRAAQIDFENTYVVYESTKAQESEKQNATTIKRVLVGIINSRIVVYLRAMQLVDEPKYGKLARIIAHIISDNNETVKTRLKKLQGVSK